MTSDESAEATRIFAASPLDREGASPFHRPRADSGGSVSRFLLFSNVGSFINILSFGQNHQAEFLIV